jgi:predicted dehydrogenase
MQQVNWGIIGCGDVTERKSGPAFNNVQDSQLVAVMRRDAGKAKDYAERHHVPKWFDDADALINDPEVNAIYVATPPSSHAQYAIKAMRAGKPVYVEKPMAMDEMECREMISVSNSTGVPIYVAYYRRALPYFEKIRELVETNRIGEVRAVNMVLHLPPQPEEIDPRKKPGWRVDPSISGGGHFHDLASHQFDFLEYAIGPIAIAAGITKNQAKWYNAPDIVSAVFEFESGALGTGSWCFTVPEKQQVDRTVIIGAFGKITFTFFGAPVLLLEDDEGKQEEIKIDHPYHIQQPLIEMVVDAILGRGICPSTGATGMRATMILDSIAGG